MTKHLLISALITLAMTMTPLANGGELSLTETDDTIRITLHGKPVLQYIKTARPVPEDVSSAVFCGPDDFRAPLAVRLNPNKPYFCFAPAVAGKFKIEPGQEWVSRYCTW